MADRPLHEVGGKGLFVRELHRAVLEGRADIAVHSFKDVPVTMPPAEQEGLMLAACPPREDPRDALISLKAKRIAELPQGARIGTGSLRRRAQLLAARPDLQIVPIRGNIDTRLGKLRRGEFDALILATAGLKRAGLYDSQIMTPIEIQEMLPAAGQGAICIQCRIADQQTTKLLLALHHAPTATCVGMEREMVRLLEGDCFSPIAALARISGQKVELRVAVGRRGGEAPLLQASAQGKLAAGDEAVAAAFRSLSDQGVRAHLRD
jgi:hydroxymethylbilane synthase